MQWDANWDETISISLMSVHATVSTTVCKALVSVALVQLWMRHVSCHRQFTRLKTRVAICPTSMGCTEGRFAQFWHAWLPLMLHKCLETLYKQWDLHLGGGEMEIDMCRGGGKAREYERLSVREQTCILLTYPIQGNNSTTGLCWCCYMVHKEDKIRTKKSNWKAF